MGESLFVSPIRREHDKQVLFSDFDTDIPSSSPLRHHGEAGDQPRNNLKPRKPPTVTPKRFNRFFTPRASRAGLSRQSNAGRQLRDITKNGANTRNKTGFLLELKNDLNSENRDARPLKRRKFSPEINSSPPQASPLRSSHLTRIEPIEHIDFSEDETSSEPACHLDVSSQVNELPGLQPIRRLRQDGGVQRILHRSFGGYSALDQGWRGSDHGQTYASEALDYVTTANDIHLFPSNALPFCAVSCNTNSLIAIGEEEGSVRLIDTSKFSDFSTPHVSFRPHSNAIMGVAFSPDDILLATASCDQKARIVDMQTQRIICTLSGHRSTVKQVRFRPDDINMLTTSSRDGTVMIWDLRCGGNGSVHHLRTAVARDEFFNGVERRANYAKHILDAGSAFRAKDRGAANGVATNRSVEKLGVSITSIQHLTHGREHILLTASELNASIKLWDLRNASRRNGLSTPLSSTPPPPSHQSSRNFGINTMLLSGDGARLYTVCRDSIVYAYSTNHLALGCDLDSGRNFRASTKAGVGPLYGFKNASFRTGSFYVNAAIRPARSGNSEMIAVGSSDGTPVLFPTDERYLMRNLDHNDDTELPMLSSRSTSDIPMHEHGTALQYGHDREVTSLTWTHGGDLVTVSDDLTARCWREDAFKARELRTSTRSETKWRCGWAQTSIDSWDDDDG